MEARAAEIVFQGAHGRTVLQVPANGEAAGGGVSVALTCESARGGTRCRLRVRALEAVSLERVALEVAFPVGPADRVLLNGFQSWTDSREFRPDERLPGLPYWLKPAWVRHRLETYGDSFFRRYSGKRGELHAYTFLALRRPDGCHRLAASLSEKWGYTVLELRRGRLVAEKDCAGVEVRGEETLLDLYLAEGDEARIFDDWFGLLGVLPPRQGRTLGWTSWYLHYTDVSESIVLDNLNAFHERKVPLQVFQIDDGWQCAVGDWLDVNEKFPRGMAAVAADIRAKGYRPGIWLAPFVCDSRSSLLVEHRDWILKDGEGKPQIAGNCDLWGGPFYALDFDNPDVKKYLEKVFHAILDEWGFEMVKLDFLYAAGLSHKPGRARGRVMRDAMEFLRKTVGDRIILGCGVPLGPAFGLCDFCRIGPDVSLGWEERAPALIHYRERISTITAITNAIGRRHLDGRAFVNDPDVFLLRDHKTTLSAIERHTLFLANAVFGNLLFTSDDVRTYDSHAWKIFASLFPAVKPALGRVWSLDGIYGWNPRGTFLQAIRGVHTYANVYVAELEASGRRYMAIFNLGPRDVEVPLGDNAYFCASDVKILTGNVRLAPHASRLFHRLTAEPRQVLGGEGHVFPGCEVAHASFGERTATVEWRTDVLQRLPLTLRVDAPGDWLINGLVCSARDEQGHWLVTVTP